jgi:hypothetical protein
MDQVKAIDLVADGLEQTSVSVSLVLTAIPERLPPGVARDELTKALTEIKANLDEMHRQLVRAGLEAMATFVIGRRVVVRGGLRGRIDAMQPGMASVQFDSGMYDRVPVDDIERFDDDQR